jgi:hypothetical protein
MKRGWMAAWLILITGSMPLTALSIRGEGGIVSFRPRATELLPENSPLGPLHGTGNITALFNFSELWGFEASLDQDPILMTRIITRLSINPGIVSFHLGPFIGSVDPFTSMIKPGLTMAMDLTIPGIFFTSLRFDTSFDSGGGFLGNFTQEYRQIEAGFWTPTMVVSATYNNRALIETAEAALFTHQWTRGFLSIDVFQKNMPYTLRFDLGYQQISWFINQDPDFGYYLKAIFGGFETAMQILPSLELLVGAETPIFAWETQNIVSASVPGGILLYRIHLGLLWTIGQ